MREINYWSQKVALKVALEIRYLFFTINLLLLLLLDFAEKKKICLFVC
jgi:hypothetical protein